MKLTSICGLGQVVPVPITSVMKHFPEEIDEHLASNAAARLASASPNEASA